ncbi:MAGUK p55 subfamily member 7-like [Sinocyclocheilus grahami]|uniref:MAGUK p55 subfamily member 7-like n=1 Tax=Sinocyclocheilus grahami TaxID=75366 RepID=UPI0007ACC0D1|nr:PREDICTED: MAGUK p55 subfamily member 7-like [Sinocyclocheilus grahami]
MPALSTRTGSEIGLYELLSVLPSQLQPHVESADDRSFLHAMFGERSLYSLVKIHEKLQSYEDCAPTPVLDSAGSLAQDLTEELQGRSASNEIRELVNLLSKPHIKTYIDIDESSNYGKPRVAERKSFSGLSEKEEMSGSRFCADAFRNETSNLLCPISPTYTAPFPVDDKKPEEIISILSQSQGAITFKVVPGIKEEAQSKEPKMFVKALFDYNPAEDKAIPCKEAGLAFRKGDILQVMSQDDATWWQAKLEGDGNQRAGLIPSKHFQERRLASWRPMTVTTLQRTPSKRFYDDMVEWVEDIEEDTEFASYLSGLHIAGLRRSFRLSRRDKKTNKSMYECKRSEQYDTADVPTYEEVTAYRRKHGDRHRLVVLVGPTGIGLNELKRKLLISDPQHFSVTIPHTSRSKRHQESDGVEYHFISKHLFEADIQNNKFIEHGEYKGNYYGTSLDSVRSVLSKNKVCLLDVQPHTLKHLRTAEFKPYVVFVKPPSIERLRETRKSAKVISGKDDKNSSNPFSTLKHLRTAEFKPYVVFVKPPSIERLRETRKSAKVISGKDDKNSSNPFSVIHAPHSFDFSLSIYHPLSS